MNKKWLMLVGLGLVVGALALSLAIPALAQEATPTVPTAPAEQGIGGAGVDFGFGFGPGKSWATYDAVAEALGLSPVELFTELHSGKTVSEIATAKGVDLQKVQDAANAARIAEQKSEIEQAVKDGTITQEQADWMLKGIEQGWMPIGRGGRGHGMGGRGFSGGTPPSVTPSASSL